MSKKNVIRIVIVILGLSFLILYAIFELTYKFPDPDENLYKIYELTESNPQKALEEINKINTSEMSESNRHFRDLVYIKAKDKASLTHKSDSLILDVLDYYSKFKDNKFYPEVLYYAGRVNYELGDMPSALSYYHKALDCARKDDITLRGKITAQLACVLGALRLSKEAIQVLNEVLAMDSITKDTLNWIYDRRDLSNAYSHLNELNIAEQISKTNLEVAKKFAPSLIPGLKIDLAKIKCWQNNYDSALQVIRNVPEMCKPEDLNDALATACVTYAHCNYPDSAYYYAQQLLKSPYENSKIDAYHTLLSPQLIHMSPQDSIISYVFEHTRYVNNKLSKNGDQSALLRNAYLNYDKHLRDKEKAEKLNNRQRVCIIVLVVMIVGLFVIILIQKLKQKVQLIALYAYKTKTDMLQNLIMTHHEALGLPYFAPDEDMASLDNKITYELSDLKSDKIDNVKELIQEKIKGIVTPDGAERNVDRKLRETPAYKDLQSYIIKGKELGEKNTLWLNLEEKMNEIHPAFFENLLILSGGKLSKEHKRVGMLIRYGVTPTEMRHLMGRSKGTISYHRKSLIKKLMNQELPTTLLDDIIRAI